MKRTPRRRRNAVTMHEVAKHAGVSPMTVSRALSGDAHVQEHMRQRVQAAIKELGYSPNVAARNLARAATVHIGLLYNNPSAAYLNELLVGVLEQSSRAGCQLVLEKCGARNERTAIERLLGDGVGGVILPPPLSDSNIALEALRSAKIPFVAVATGRPEGAGLSVRIDDMEAAAAMTRYLLSLGHRDIGFIVGAANQTVSAQRRAGFELALREAEVPLHPEWVKQGSFSYHSGLVAADQMLSGARKPTAIFASNDDMAAAAACVARQMGLELPGHLSIAGFDDAPVASMMWPQLATVHQPVRQVARIAADLIIQHRPYRHGWPRPMPRPRLDLELVIRGSIAPSRG